MICKNQMGIDMHKALVISNPSIAGSSELVVLAPIRNGFVPGLDAVTYKTRAKLLLKALHAGRKTAHEYNLIRAVSDAVERVGVIHSLRVTVLEPEDKILLSVNFDGAYEAYVRVIWQKTSRLLDLIFCNTEGYPLGWNHSYTEWNNWLQLRRVETPFYYSAPGLTRPDVTYLHMLERFERRDENADQNVTRLVTPDAESIAWTLVRDSIDLQSGPYMDPNPASVPPGAREGVRQGLQGLAGIYRMADFYPPGTEDGLVLHRAARELLPEFVRMLKLPLEYGQAIESAGAKRFRDALDWITADEPLPAVRVKPPLTEDPSPALPTNAQAGILRAYKGDITHGCICLVAFDSAVAFVALQRAIPVTVEGSSLVAGEPSWNLALTYDGLRACGVGEAVLEQLPIEFRQGMAQRAGLLGDVHGNHPRRWQLPRQNWPQAVNQPDEPDPAAPPVALEAVHALLQVRLSPKDGVDLDADLRPLIGALLTKHLGDLPGVRPLSVQWLKRLFGANRKVVEHFGYTDGQSQPEFGRQDTWFFPNQVHLGEALLGHPNAADATTVLDEDLKPLLLDGSFLVVRKLRQDVIAFERAVSATATAYHMHPELLKGKLMGRMPGSGAPLVESIGVSINDFNYQEDKQGLSCPIAAHIRKANPREIDGIDAAQVQPLPGGRPPRLFRRSLSFVAPTNGKDSGDQGLMFMAYNASIGEQFEVVQRWLAGGNSSGGYSGASDPFLGVPEAGKSRWFRFQDGARTIRMRIDGSDDLGTDPRPLVRLEWGAYFFAPSITGLAHLATLADGAAKEKFAPPWRVSDGVRKIEDLRRIERQSGPQAAAQAWKAALEDSENQSNFSSASILAAVRDRFGGLLRTPFGVLVADATLIDSVLTDRGHLYTVGGYQKRLQNSIGPIFLGLDEGPEYQQQSKACNDEIMKLSFEEGFRLARDVSVHVLSDLVDDAKTAAKEQRELVWELNLDFREVVAKVLAKVVEEWFGITHEGGHFEARGFSWAWREKGPAYYPGQFISPSRSTFQPLPGELVEDLALRQGRHLRKRMTSFLNAHHKTMGGRVSRAVLDAQGSAPDLDLAARTIVGAIMGFVPTIEGGSRRIVAEWLRDGTMWQLRASVGAGALNDGTSAAEVLHAPICRAMQLRPVPELIWRTAKTAHELARTVSHQAESVQSDDRLILALVSATHQGLESNQSDVRPIFGGVRKQVGSAPTHACPGYLPAMGIITGLLSALVDTHYQLRPATTHGILSFEGDFPAPDYPIEESMSDVVKHGWRKGSFASVFSVRGLQEKAAQRKKLLAWGDSWFTLTHPFTDKEWDLRWALAELGFETGGFVTHSRSGLRLAEMAAVPRRTAFYSTVRAQRPDAVLIDGGGNDIHALDAEGKQPLTELLREGNPSDPFKPGAIAKFVHERLAGQLTTVLKNLIDATEGKTPIFVHGYDYPLPDGEGFPHYPGPWLAPVITGRYGYTFAQGCEIMKILIGELNNMIALLAAKFASDSVHHLKLTDTLAAQPGYDLKSGYRKYWLNELHPSVDGHRALAREAKKQIETVLVPASVGRIE